MTIKLKTMTIETKYNVGDKVYTNFGGVPTQCKIIDVGLCEHQGVIIAIYTVTTMDERGFGTRFSKELSLTKEGLSINTFQWLKRLKEWIKSL